MELKKDPKEMNKRLLKIQNEYHAKSNREKNADFFAKLNEPVPEKNSRLESSPNVSKIKISSRKLPNAPPGNKNPRADLRKGTGSKDGQSGKGDRSKSRGSREK